MDHAQSRGNSLGRPDASLDSILAKDAVITINGQTDLAEQSLTLLKSFGKLDTISFKAVVEGASQFPSTFPCMSTLEAFD